MGRLVGEMAIERSERTLGMLNYYWAVVREASSCKGAVSAVVRRLRSRYDLRSFWHGTGSKKGQCR